MTISFLLDVFLLTDNVGFLLSDDKDIPPFLVGYVIPSSAYILMFILFQKQTYESSFRKSSNQPFLQNSQFIFSQKTMAPKISKVSLRKFRDSCRKFSGDSFGDSSISLSKDPIRKFAIQVQVRNSSPSEICSGLFRNSLFFLPF